MSKVVDKLLESHYKHLSDSGIADVVIIERGYRSIFGKSEPAVVEAGFLRSQIRAPGILIPLLRPDGSNGAFQYRPDNPRTGDNHKPIKYETPKGAGNVLDVPKRCIPMLGDPKIPLWHTEGAKKADAGASNRLCMVNLIGVWGWKGKNEHGATVVLGADFDHIALKNRIHVMAFDADNTVNKQVRLAQLRYAEFLNRKGGIVKYCNLPADGAGNKMGIDDYLAAGHSVDDLWALVSDDLPVFVEPPQAEIPVITNEYIVHADRLCWKKQKQNGGYVIEPLCNFTANILEEIIHDDGIEEKRCIAIEGQLHNGISLPVVKVPASSFSSMSWVPESWGMAANISPGNSIKDNLRNAIQITAEGKQSRRVYSHTGWRVIDGERVFLMPTGSIGASNVNVDLGDLTRYGLPFDTSEIAVKDAVRCSVNFLNISNRPEVTYPLWGILYSAPLEEIINHDFLLWYAGGTGTLKSSIQGQGLSHYGVFNYKTLPLAWGSGSTAKGLLKRMSSLKDVVSCIDDWAPGATLKQQNESEQMAELIIRSIGNKAKQAKLQADGAIAKTYGPRGAVIASGEQLPSGQGRNARIFVVDMRPDDLDLEVIILAEQEKHLYPFAMSGYIDWLRRNWDYVVDLIRPMRREWRTSLSSNQMHKRLPGAVATLYSGIYLGLLYAEEVGAISSTEAGERRSVGWDCLVSLADRHSATVNMERPGNRFLDGFRVLFRQSKFVFLDTEKVVPNTGDIKPTQIFAGWEDESYFYLDPGIVFTTIREYLNRDEPFTIKAKPLWDDLRYLGSIDCTDVDRNRTKKYIGKHPNNISAWVVPLKKSVVFEVKG